VTFEIEIDFFFFLNIYFVEVNVSSASDINMRTPVKIVFDSYNTTGNHSYHDTD
jgi:hypothetical protein